MRCIAWDTETALFRAGVQAPELACLSYCEIGPGTAGRMPQDYVAGMVDAVQAVDLFRSWITDPNVTLIGANVAFDCAVMCAADPTLVPLVFDAYDAGRIRCVQIRQRLIDNAKGELKFRTNSRGDRVRVDMKLDTLAVRHLRWKLEKDEFRYGYGELRAVPMSQWPEGALKYPLDDARATAGVWIVQESRANYSYELADEIRQTCKYWCLRLVECWGLRTDPAAVDAFAADVEILMSRLRAELETVGFYRPDGSRDLGAIGRAMVETCARLGRPVEPTDAAEKALARGEAWDFSTGKGVKLDSDTCEEFAEEDWRFARYAEAVALSSVASKDLPMLRAGRYFPVHTHFGMAETGRTTSSGPNIQNFRRLPGIRECFRPREGFVYFSADYPALELHTLAQCCIWFLGQSRLAEVLNSGEDPHMMMAASLLHCSYEWCKANKKDPAVVRARQFAKIANFGFPGGLGPDALVEYAAGQGVIIEGGVIEARALRDAWFKEWPEMRAYFAFINRLCEAGENKRATIIHPMSGRVRGDVKYTSACNGFFQGLGVDAASEALRRVVRACYVDRSDPLYGSRIVNFIHDEIVGETPNDDRASDVAKQLAWHMKEGANLWLPDVPFLEVEPQLSDRLSKEAKTILDDDGRVLVWRGSDDVKKG